MPEALRPAEGSPVVPASRGGPSPRRTCIQAIVKNVEVMMQRVNASGVEAYRGLVDLVASLRETPGPKTVVLVSAGFAIALDAGVFDELAIRAALSDVVVDAVLVEPVAAPNSRKLVPANIISERRSLMRRLSELATSALGTAHSAVGGSQEPIRLADDGVDPLPPGRASGGGRDAGRRREGHRGGRRRRPEREGASVLRAAGAARRRPPRPRRTRGWDVALAGTPPEGERLPFDAAGYLAGLPGDTAALLIAGEVPLPRRGRRGARGRCAR